MALFALLAACDSGGGTQTPRVVCDLTDVTADCDGDGVNNGMDVDDDGDGLIEIATAAELNNVRNDLDGTHYNDGTNPENASGCPATGGCNGYELTQNIALTGALADWNPIGDSTTPFSAIFDGNNFTISGLAIVDKDNAGFFGASQ